MTGAHEKTREKTEEEKKPKNIFADVVVGICLLVSLFITAAVIWEYHRLGVVMPAGVLTALFGFWGGELFILALRQIFGSDAVEKATAKKYNNTTYGGSV